MPNQLNLTFWIPLKSVSEGSKYLPWGIKPRCKVMEQSCLFYLSYPVTICGNLEVNPNFITIKNISNPLISLLESTKQTKSYLNASLFTMH